MLEASSVTHVHLARQYLLLVVMVLVILVRTAAGVLTVRAQEQISAAVQHA